MVRYRLTRRGLIAAAAAGGTAVLLPRRGRAQQMWKARQFHNQPAESHQQRFLVGLWDDVRKDTGGRVDVSVHPQNDNVPGSDPQALKMLVGGELEFFSLMGGILGQAVPVMEIQGLPFAFASPDQVYEVMDSGPFAAHLRQECAAKGIHLFPAGALENGFRDISMVDKPIRTADDLAGQKIRVPDGEMFRDLFSTLGAVPVTINIRELYDGLKAHKVDGQENPLVVTEVNKLYEVTKYVSVTHHMWSGFNLLANLKFWTSLPSDIQAVVNRNVVKYVAMQRKYTDDLNDALATKLKDRGLVFNQADMATFRGRLGPFYARWKQHFGETAWNLLERQVGSKLG
ncbi:MAG TPA: TRAP transporter substrate-binding protein [Alphaproteobacteria bacterium]